MSIEAKFYKEVNGQNYKLSVYYDKGKGYWMVIVPVTITQKDGYSIEEFGAFTGLKETILLVDRKTKKRTEEAINIALSKRDEFIIKIESKNKKEIL